VQIIKKKLKKFQEKSDGLKKEVQERTLSYLVAAFSLVAGLAWNDVVRSLIDYFFPIHRDSILAKFLYAALVTLFVVFVTVYLIKLLKKEEG